MRLLQIASYGLCVFFLLSCDKATEVVVTQENSPLLAEVNGKKIHQQDLDNLLVEMFGEYQASTLDESAREKALQSLVASRAMVDLSLAQIEPSQLQSIEAKTKRYRENLLINLHVKNNMVPEPVTNQMIEDYYRGHLQRFGQKTIRQYELLSTTTVLPAEVRDRFLQAFAILRTQAAGTVQPENIQQKLKKQGFDIQYHKAITGQNLLEPKLRDFIQAQTLKELSNITFIDGKAYAVLVNADITTPATPLSAVREDVRKSLAMMQLKKAIKSLSETAVEQASIVYHNSK